MRLLRSLVYPLFVLALFPALAFAQAKIAPGAYRLVPDSTYASDFDAASVDIEFTENTMTVSAGGSLVLKSSFTIAGDIATVTDTEGPVACPTTAKYKITMSKTGFRMNPVEEACPEAASVLRQVTFVKR